MIQPRTKREIIIILFVALRRTVACFLLFAGYVRCLPNLIRLAREYPELRKQIINQRIHERGKTL